MKEKSLAEESKKIREIFEEFDDEDEGNKPYTSVLEDAHRSLYG